MYKCIHDCCEQLLSPAGSESPHRDHCWRTEGRPTLPFSGTSLWSRHLRESRTHTPQHGGGALSHLTEDKKRREEEEVHESHLLSSHLKGHMHQVHMSNFNHPSVWKTECTSKSHCRKKRRRQRRRKADQIKRCSAYIRLSQQRCFQVIN